MKKYLFIAAGGALGAISRYLIKNIHIINGGSSFPVNTLLINVTGSFLLALILTIAFKYWSFDTNIRLGIATGFLGAYTTFSTMCKETSNLIMKGMYSSATLYISLSLFLGLLFVYLGVVSAHKVGPKFTHLNNTTED